MIHDLILREYSERFAALFDGLLGFAHDFARLASAWPWSNARYNAGGRLNASARNLWQLVQDYRLYGFPVAGLNTLDESFQAFLDVALRFGEAYHRADALYEAGEGEPRDRFTPAFHEADMLASDALQALEQAALRAFGVEEGLVC